MEADMHPVRFEDRHANQAAHVRAPCDHMMQRAITTLLVLVVAAAILLPTAARAGIPAQPSEPPRAYTSYPSEPTSCSEWYSTGDRWEFWCYLEYPEGDYWVLDVYYWEPDAQAAVNFRYCGGALSYWWYVCCGTSGACDA